MTVRILQHTLGEKYNQDEFRKYTKEFQQNYYANHKIPVKKGLYVLLEYFKREGYKMTVASSSPRRAVSRLWFYDN